MPKRTPKDYEISRIQLGLKPFQKDLKQIDNLTKTEFKGNYSDCLRTLVREALLRRRLVSEGKDATLSIVKDSQAQVIDARLHPLIKQIDGLTEQIRQLTEANKELTKNITNSTQGASSNINEIYKELQALNSNFDQSKLFDEINKQIAKLMLTLQPLAVHNEVALKNIIAMRGLFYVFLLGYQSGSIEEANKLSRGQWMFFVRDMQKKINNLSFEEFTKLDGIGQHNFIENYAKELFTEIAIVPEEVIKNMRKNLK